MKVPNSHEDWFLDFPSRVLEGLGVRLIIPVEWPTDSVEPLHCRVPGTISSSMSSISSDMMKCWGVALPPMKVGSRLSDEASDGRPGLLTMVKPVRISICCQRLSLSRRAAVTSPSACLQRWHPHHFNRHNYSRFAIQPNDPSLFQFTLQRLSLTYFAASILWSTSSREELWATWKVPKRVFLFFFIFSACGDQTLTYCSRVFKISYEASLI